MTPTPPAQPVAEQSWITTYGPLLIASVALVSAILALLGVWLNNHYAAKRQRADVRAAVRRQNREIAAAEGRRKEDVIEAEQRRVRDAAAIDERELSRHRRETLSVKLSDFIAVALSMVPAAVDVHGYRRYLGSEQGAANSGVNRERARALQAHEDRSQSILDQLTSLNYQVQMLAPPPDLYAAVDRVVVASFGMQRAARLGGASAEAAQEARRASTDMIPEFDDALDALKDAAQDLVMVYRSTYGLGDAQMR